MPTLPLPIVRSDPGVLEGILHDQNVKRIGAIDIRHDVSIMDILELGRTVPQLIVERTSIVVFRFRPVSNTCKPRRRAVSEHDSTYCIAVIHFSKFTPTYNLGAVMEKSERT